MKKTILLMSSLILLLTGCEIYDPNDEGMLVPLTVDDDPAISYIEVNGTRLHSEAFGEPADPMIVILHGGPGSDYREMLKFIMLANEGYYVVFFDQRGSGLSRRHDPDVFTLNNYLNDLDGVIEHYRNREDQQIFFIGHSWGAMYATLYINYSPAKIAGAVLSEPGGFTDEQVGDYLSKTWHLEYLAEWLNDEVWADQFITAGEHATMDYRMARGGTEPNTGSDESKPCPFWRNGAVANVATLQNNPDYDFTTNLDQYTKKILFLYSELNPSYGYEHAVKVSSAYPAVDLVEIKGYGHDLDFNGFDEYIRVTRTYLNEMKTQQQ